MVKEILQSIEGIAIFPVIGLILFVISFLLVLYWVWRMKARDIDEASRLPLDDGTTSEGKPSSTGTGANKAGDE